jgi:hypothetical protein
MVKWTEVNAYTGRPVDEDAPTNSAGSGAVAMPADAMMKKKKKTFLDARTKAYKAHQKKLEASRQRREERKKVASKMNEELPFSQKIKEQVSAFGRESFLAENNMDVIKSIVKSKGAKDLKMKDGKLKMDAFTASAIAQVYDKVNPANKKKMEDLANGKKSDLMKLQKLAMKFVK